MFWKTFLIVLVGSLFLASQALANGCDDGSLSGSYAVHYQGFIQSAPNWTPGQPRGGYVPVTALIVVTFDGAGGILPSSGGHIQTGTLELFFDVTDGEYAVSPDCTGTLLFETTIPRPFIHTIAVTGDGEEFTFVRSLPLFAPVGIVQSGTARRMNLAE